MRLVSPPTTTATTALQRLSRGTIPQRMFRRSINYQTLPDVINLQSKQKFQQTTRDNTLFQTLREQILKGKLQLTANQDEATPQICSPSTLPPTVSAITAERQLMASSPVASWRYGPTLWYRIAKRVVNIHKDGFKAIYGIHRQYRRGKGGNSDNSNNNGHRFTLSDSHIPYNTNAAILQSLETSSLQMTRREFVELHRRLEFTKLPYAAALFYLLGEFFLLMAYVWPRLSLRSCWTVGMYKRWSERHSFDVDLGEKFASESVQLETLSSPYGLELKDLGTLLRTSSVNVIPTWQILTWQVLGIKWRLAEAVADIYQFLVIDDWLLLRGILGTGEQQQGTSCNPVRLSYNELVDMIMERQLYHSGEDLNGMVNDEVGRQVLLWRLVCYLAFRFNGVDITSDGFNNRSFTDKWGVNNISVFNFPGTYDNGVVLVDKKHLEFFTN